jgi:hypothetical protein
VVSGDAVQMMELEVSQLIGAERSQRRRPIARRIATAQAAAGRISGRLRLRE